jgi:hypothetical protein
MLQMPHADDHTACALTLQLRRTYRVTVSCSAVEERQPQDKRATSVALVNTVVSRYQYRTLHFQACHMCFEAHSR